MELLYSTCTLAIPKPHNRVFRCICVDLLTELSLEYLGRNSHASAGLSSLSICDLLPWYLVSSFPAPMRRSLMMLTLCQSPGVLMPSLCSTQFRHCSKTVLSLHTL